MIFISAIGEQLALSVPDCDEMLSPNQPEKEPIVEISQHKPDCKDCFIVQRIQVLFLSDYTEKIIAKYLCMDFDCCKLYCSCTLQALWLSLMLILWLLHQRLNLKSNAMRNILNLLHSLQKQNWLASSQRLHSTSNLWETLCRNWPQKEFCTYGEWARNCWAGKEFPAQTKLYSLEHKKAR